MNLVETIRNKALPPDSLDNNGDKFLALFAPSLGCLVFGLSLFFNWGPLNEPVHVKIYCFVFCLTVLVYTIFAFYTERNLEKLATGLGQDDNLLLANLTLKGLKWPLHESDNKFIKTVQIDSWGMNNGYKLVIIIADNAIYFNIRNRGSYKGRLPYAFGGNLFYALKFRNKLITTKLKLTRV